MWWRFTLKGLRAEKIYVQLQNRGTAHGILYALIQIQQRPRFRCGRFTPGLSDARRQFDSFAKSRGHLAAEIQELVIPQS
jgi:hypothetical protein